MSLAGGGMKKLSGLGGYEALHSCGDDLVNECAGRLES